MLSLTAKKRPFLVNRVSFYDLPQKRISGWGESSLTTHYKWSLGSQSGNPIGSGIINSVEYVTGTPGYDAKYNIYLSDITMNGSNTFSNVRSLYYSQSPSAIGADIVGASNTSTNTALSSLTQSPLLYYVGANYTRSVRASDGTGATIYNFNRTAGVDSAITTSANGILTLIPTLATKESIPYNGVLSTTDVSQDLTMTFNESINIGPLWSGATVTRSFAVGEENVLFGAGTYFNDFNVGDRIELADAPGGSPIFYVQDISSNTIMLLSNAVPSAVTASKIFKAYKVNDIVNLIGKGVDNGTKRTVTATAANLTFDLKETFSTTVPANITYKLASTVSTSNNNLSSVIVRTNNAIVSATNHGFSAGDRAYLLITGGDSANVSNGYYTVTDVENANTFNISSRYPITTNASANLYTKNNEIVIVNHAASNGNSVYVSYISGDQSNTTNGIYSSVKISSDKFRITTGQPVTSNSGVNIYYSTNLYSNIFFTESNHSLHESDNVRIEFESAGISNGIYTVKTVYGANSFNIAYNANTYVNTTSNTLVYSALGLTANIVMQGTALISLYK